jgi:hypothetical protein
LTLLVKSKMRGFEGERDRIPFSGDAHSYGVGD